MRHGMFSGQRAHACSFFGLVEQGVNTLRPSLGLKKRQQTTGLAIDDGFPHRCCVACQDGATAASALALLFRAGVKRIDPHEWQQMQADTTRTTFLLDVRTPPEYDQGHLPGAVSAPGGQLIQETDHYLAVRGARVVVYDNDGVRASMAASWLAQMGWEVYVLKDIHPDQFTEKAWPTAQLPDTIEPV
ncbi:MAG: hypothetical protein EB110_13200, partial [Betaproteobacteria bacterium]|nr:hypothetical protein [Betaproteobacteria bacterium]